MRTTRGDIDEVVQMRRYGWLRQVKSRPTRLAGMEWMRGGGPGSGTSRLAGVAGSGTLSATAPPVALSEAKGLAPSPSKILRCAQHDPLPAQTVTHPARTLRFAQGDTSTAAGTSGARGDSGGDSKCGAYPDRDDPACGTSSRDMLVVS